MDEQLLWICQFGLENIDIWPGGIPEERLPANEALAQALIEYRRDIAEGHEKLLRVYRSAGKRWLKFLNTPKART